MNIIVQEIGPVDVDAALADLLTAMAELAARTRAALNTTYNLSGMLNAAVPIASESAWPAHPHNYCEQL